jgi:hypothetical protein
MVDGYRVSNATPSSSSSVPTAVPLPEPQVLKYATTTTTTLPKKKYHHFTVCMVPPSSGNTATETETDTDTAWTLLTRVHTELWDPGLYRWPPHVNLLYPFPDVLDCDVATANEKEEEDTATATTAGYVRTATSFNLVQILL